LTFLAHKGSRRAGRVDLLEQVANLEFNLELIEPAIHVLYWTSGSITASDVQSSV